MATYTVGTGGDYATFAAAQAGSYSSGDWLVLIQDFTEQLTLPNGTDGLTIDLNGYTIDGEETRDYCIDLADVCDNIQIINGTVKGAVENNIRWSLSSNAGSTVRNLTVNNVVGGSTKQLAASPATPAVTTGTGILVDTTGYIPAIANVSFTSCEQSDCGKHGFDFRGNVRGTLTGPVARRNGTPGATSTYGGHGITFHPWRQDWASQAWTSQGAGVYSKVRQNANDVPTHVVNWTDSEPLVRTSGTETSPAAGEWGYDSGTIYVQLADSADPSTHEIRYLRIPFGPLTVVNPVCTDTKTDVGGGEGNGLAFDSVSYRVTVNGGLFENNQGHGVNAVMALDCDLIGALVKGNTTRGVRFQSTTVGSSIRNATVLANGGIGVHIQGAINTSVSNTLSANNTGANFTANAAATPTLTDETNASYNGGVADVGFTPSVTTDPLIDANGRPKAGSSLHGAGAKWWSAAADVPIDRDGRVFPLRDGGAVPDVGAFVMRRGGVKVGATQAKAVPVVARVRSA